MEAFEKTKPKVWTLEPGWASALVLRVWPAGLSLEVPRASMSSFPRWDLHPPPRRHPHKCPSFLGLGNGQCLLMIREMKLGPVIWWVGGAAHRSISGCFWKGGRDLPANCFILPF